METPGYISASQRTYADAARRQAALEALSRDLADKELELVTLENEVAAFERRYAETIGVLLAELDEIERQIAEEQLRLESSDVHRIRLWQAGRKARESDEYVKARLRSAAKRPVTPSKTLKSLYRKVAKSVHPDLSIQKIEHSFREELMTRANVAFRSGDRSALERILTEWNDWIATAIGSQSGHLDELDRQIVQVRKGIVEIEKKLGELKKSEPYQMKSGVESAKQEGFDLLQAIADDIRRQTYEAKMRLDLLKRSK
jgi:hypothetical protein